jgi:hypothetical protein
MRIAGQRLPEFAELPTVAETIPGFTAAGWQIVVAPNGTPDAIIRAVSQDLAKVVSDPDRDSCEMETPTEAVFSLIGFLNENSHILGRPIKQQTRDVRCWGLSGPAARACDIRLVGEL